MIVKRLRQKNNWSQEQLATMSGLSVRTIQRIESGQSASLETLKSLASVFETDVSKLTEEIQVIDKQSEKWKEQPWLVRYMLFGVRTRVALVAIELSFFFIGVILLYADIENRWIMSFIFAGYFTGLTIRHADKNNLWDI